jgi:predicted MFS family arabinose efflux permease
MAASAGRVSVRHAHRVLIVLGLAAGPVVALGLARFAYSLLLPTMRSDLGWGFTAAGAMNSANALGYMIGAVATGPVVARFGARNPFLIGLVLTTLMLGASAGTGNLGVLLALRLVVGVTGALVFVAGTGLANRIAHESGSGATALLGLYFAGGGAGIVLSAGLVPPVVDRGGDSWRAGWLVLTAASVAALGAAFPAALRCPDVHPAPSGRMLGWPVRDFTPSFIAYAFFGAGYIAYITFIVAYLKADGAGPHTIAGFWAVLGAAGVLTGFAWGPVLNALRGGHGLAVVLALTAFGAVLPPALAGSRTADYVSAVCFGGSVLAVVTAVTNLTRRGLPPAQVPAGIAIATVCFSVGQAVGPVLAGALSQGASGTRAGLWLGVAFLGAGSVVALVQEEFRAPPVLVSQKHPPGEAPPRPAEKIYL